MNECASVTCLADTDHKQPIGTNHIAAPKPTFRHSDMKASEGNLVIDARGFDSAAVRADLVVRTKECPG